MEIVFNKKEGHHEFVGSVDLWVDTSTYVDIDGKRYWNRSKEKRTFTSKELYNRMHSYIKEFNFDIIGYSFKVKLPYANPESLMTAYSNSNFSELPEVNFIQSIFNNGLLPEEITCVFSGKDKEIPWSYVHSLDVNNIKDNHYFKKLINSIREVNFCCFGYGFNNGVYYNISSKALLETEYKNLPEYLLKTLIKLNIFLKKQNIERNAENLLKYKIDNYRGKLN